MPDSFNELKELKHIKLDIDAKQRVRERLSLYASLKPSAHQVRRITSSEQIPFSAFFRSRASKMLASSLVLVIAGVSSIHSAETAVPGDFLYPVKVHVNEETRALFARSPESKAALEVTRLSRRLEEAEQLAVEGRLSAQAESKLAEQIGSHSRAARSHIADSSKEGGTLAVQQIEATLISTIAAHDGVITDLVAATEPEVEEEVLPLESVQSVLQAEIVASATASSTEAVEVIDPELVRERQVALGQALVALEHEVESEELLGETTKVQALRLFGEILAANAEAKQLLRDSDEVGAFAAIIQGEQALGELETLLKIGDILKSSLEETKEEETEDEEEDSTPEESQEE